ncbi:BatD family protein [Salinispirillum sp. LH 10-3-1]|uniref:BatD family protein n=1 Tax=Salinispirillum sp. LH 10-3-1 TaxID=2952525 RepID=A0AB38YKF4_9GAMM
MVNPLSLLRTCLTLCLVAWLAMPIEAQASVLANVNKTTLVEGDTLVLRIRTRAENSEIDLAPLLTDFRVLSQSHMTSSTSFSGVRNTFLEWELQLAPRKTGRLEIPALTVGNEQTRPIAITVLEMSPQQRSQQRQMVQLDVEVNEHELYVGQSTVVTLELLYTVNVNGTFADVSPENAEWEQLGERMNGITQRNGQEYRYTRFHYLYTPTQPGTVELPAFTFNGTYRQNAWAPAQTINGLQSDPIPLQVKPIPDSFPANARWLPARDLTLTEQWSEDSLSVPSGHQITRTANLAATGPARHRLPELLSNQNLPSGVRAYPSLPDTQQQITNGQRRSVRQERASYLFGQSGEYELPEIRIPWWDLDNDQLRWAQLPARTIRVVGPATLPLTQDAPTAQTTLPSLDEAISRGPSRLYWLLMILFILNGALLWYLLNRPGQPWLISLRHRLRWRPRRRLPQRSNSEPAASVANKEPENRHKLRAKGPDWRQPLIELAHSQQWGTLLNTLAKQFASDGWPDVDAVSARHQKPNFAALVRDTQALHYGADTGSEAEQRLLSTRWEALLTGWQDSKPVRSKSSKNDRIKKLYPD